MKASIKKLWQRIVPQKLRFTIYKYRYPFLNRMQNNLMTRRVKVHAKRTQLVLPKIVSIPTYPLDTLNTLDSLPEITFPYRYSLDTFKTLDSMILSKLQLLQFGIPFQESKFFVHNLSHVGFGWALLIPLCRGLACSYLYNRTFLIDDSNLVYDFCYEPISTHSLREVKNKYPNMVEQNYLSQKRVVYLDRGLHYPKLSSKFVNFVDPLSLPMNSLYIMGLILGSFLKLKQEYKMHIEEKRKELGFKSPAIGVHIRQGDALTNFSTKYRNLSSQGYLEIVKHVVDKTGIDTVFVTTDSEEVIRQLPKNSGINFIYDDKEIRYNNENALMLRDHPELRKQETMTVVKNIHLLSECDYIIGNSSWTQNAVALSYFRNKKLNGIHIPESEIKEIEYLNSPTLIQE